MQVKNVFLEDQSHIRILTGLRGWAALWVLISHVWNKSGYGLVTIQIFSLNLDLTPFFSAGWAGVQIFFVLSGFLLGIPFAHWQNGSRAEKPQINNYLFRRVARVFPAYYVQLVILTSIDYLGAHANLLHNFSALWRHLLMLFVPAPVGTTPLVGVWWTLPIEFMFYLTLPFLAPLVNPRRWLVLLVFSLVSMLLWRYGTIVFLGDEAIHTRVLMALQLPGSMDSFGLGLLGSLLYINAGTLTIWLIRLRAAMGLIGITLAIFCIYWIHFNFMSYWSHSFIFYSWTILFSFSILLIAIAGAKGSRMINLLFGNKFINYIGIVSYSVYLWHYPILSSIASVHWMGTPLSTNLPLFMLATLVLTVLTASISYVAVERPFIRMRRRQPASSIRSTV